jgi:hypothetical protein
MAITAWSAKVAASSICFSVNGSDQHYHANRVALPQQWDAQHGAIACPFLSVPEGIFRIRK